MSTPLKILVVSASTGTGHTRAAEALCTAFSELPDPPATEHVDLLSLAARWVGVVYGGGYELLATRAPWLWREVYRRTDAPDADLARWGPAVHRVLFREFNRLLQSGVWGVCLCTHFLPAQLAAGRPGAPPFSMVITDRTLHRYWAQPRVRAYFVASNELAADLRARLPGAQVEVTGIPIDPRFARALSRSSARETLGLDLRTAVALVMGGGLGLGVEEMVAAVLRAPVSDLHVLAVCGRNSEAAERLRAAYPGSSRVRVFGFTSEIPLLISGADVVVTKAGGLTTSEALAAGRPLILTRPIPGQEEGNMDVLTAAGAAVKASGARELTDHVGGLFASRPTLRLMQERAEGLGAPNSARHIAETVRSVYGIRTAAA